MNLAPYATRWQDSRGRLHDEAPSRYRTPFQRDRDRIIHSSAFRRLINKTQVFISPEGDHIRTRLTHSLEVAQVARAIARTLGTDEDLAETVALAHDLGHTPFGHTGEDALDEMMAPYGGFDHNDQALRVLVHLERRYIDFDGLNLTWETLEGVVKHNGPMVTPESGPDRLPTTIRHYNENQDLRLDEYASLEAQVAAIADDIAYNHHDMDDGLRACLFTVEEVCDQVPHVGAVFQKLRTDHPNVEESVLTAVAVRQLIGEMVDDVVEETKNRLKHIAAERPEDIRTADQQMVAFTDTMREKERQLKAFLFKHMYRAPSVNAERKRAYQIVCGMFRHYLKYPDKMPAEWQANNQALVRRDFGRDTARAVADYIAGMTDRFAMAEAVKLNV
ncbi:deoxyguanosinetriphosphate triphosphohydrolase [Aestuariispira insulae]